MRPAVFAVRAQVCLLEDPYHVRERTIKVIDMKISLNKISLNFLVGDRGRYVGRVAGLAIAVGVGGAIAAMPQAYADTTDSGGAAADSGSSSSTTRGGLKSAAAQGPRNRSKVTPRRGSDARDAARGQQKSAPAAGAARAGPTMCRKHIPLLSRRHRPSLT
jgi:hypothetical protein